MKLDYEAVECFNLAVWQTLGCAIFLEKQVSANLLYHINLPDDCSFKGSYSLRAKEPKATKTVSKPINITNKRIKMTDHIPQNYILLSVESMLSLSHSPSHICTHIQYRHTHMQRHKNTHKIVNAVAAQL